MRGEAGAEQHLGESLLRCCISTGSDKRQQWRLVAGGRQANGLHGMPLALETHRRASEVLRIASSAAGTARTRSHLEAKRFEHTVGLGAA